MYDPIRLKVDGQALFLSTSFYCWLVFSSMLCQVVCSISFADSTLNTSDKKTPPPRPPPPTVSQAYTPSTPPSIPSTSEPTAPGKCYNSRIQPSSFTFFCPHPSKKTAALTSATSDVYISNGKEKNILLMIFILPFKFVFLVGTYCKKKKSLIISTIPNSSFAALSN